MQQLRHKKHTEHIEKDINRCLFLSVIILNINGFNSPFKREMGRMDEYTWFKYMLPTRNSLDIQKQTGWKWNLKNKFHADCSQNRAGVAILTSEKTDFKPRKVTSQRRTLYINKLMGKNGNWQILFAWAPKSLWMVTAAKKLRRLLRGRKAMTNLVYWKSRDITFPTKSHLVKTIVFPAVMYTCESWTIKAKCWRIDAFEMWCWRRLLRVPWTARR